MDFCVKFFDLNVASTGSGMRKYKTTKIIPMSVSTCYRQILMRGIYPNATLC